MEHNTDKVVKFPTVDYFTSVADDLNSGLPRTNPGLDLNSGPPNYKSSALRDNHFIFILFFILLASLITKQWIINKCLISRGATTAMSQLQWSHRFVYRVKEAGRRLGDPVWNGQSKTSYTGVKLTKYRDVLSCLDSKCLLLPTSLILSNAFLSPW